LKGLPTVQGEQKLKLLHVGRNRRPGNFHQLASAHDRACLRRENLTPTIGCSRKVWNRGEEDDQPKQKPMAEHLHASSCPCLSGCLELRHEHGKDYTHSMTFVTCSVFHTEMHTRAYN
jgi:hypothetical protein